MASDYFGQRSEDSSSSSSITITSRTACQTPSQDTTASSTGPPSRSSSASSASTEPDSYAGASYDVKGKRRASQDDEHDLSGAIHRLSVEPESSLTPTQNVSSTQESPTSIVDFMASRLPPAARKGLAAPVDRERRIRKGRDMSSRSVAPSPLRSALNTSPTTASASQFASLLGQPTAVSASLSAPDKSSAAATSAALPSLYKASRGRSMNVSPSRRWDRRGASATVLSGASASGSGGEGDDPSDDDIDNSRMRSSSRRLSVAKEEALFPPDDDSPPFSPSEEVGNPVDAPPQGRRRSRRWSSIERERRRGMRILLQEHSTQLGDSVSTLKPSRRESSSRGRTRSTLQSSSTAEDDDSDVDLSSSLSSCSSSCDRAYVPRRGDTAAIPITGTRSRSKLASEIASTASVSAASSQGNVPSSMDDSDDPSPAASTPSTSLVQRSPPGLAALKPIIAIPVTSEADPLLGLATPSVEDMIQVDKVEFFPEEAITAQLASDKTKRKTSPKRAKKSSWIIGDFESEPESDDEPRSAQNKLDTARKSSNATALNASPPSPTASSYQARLASLQSQLRIWSRTPEAPAAPRVRETSSGSEGQTDTEADTKDADSASSSLLSASWRNLTRLPNLILLPGLAARQARESLAASAKAQDGTTGSDGKEASAPTSENDFAQIYRLASSSQGSSDESVLQAQRNAAIKTGRPPSPSPPTSLLGSRQSSDDSISTTDQAYSARNPSNASRSGRGVASPLEADRDPSAYVSGLGQPIDPDTELSSVVQLQTFRSRSRSRPADPAHRGRGAAQSRSYRHQDRHDDARGPRSPKQLGQAIELEPTEEEKENAPAATADRPGAGGATGALAIQIPSPTRQSRRDLFADGPAPTDTASAPTSPTFRKGALSSASSADEADAPSPPRAGEGSESSSVDADGFRIVRRRPHRRFSGSKSLRPKVDALVPQGFSAFAGEDGDEKVGDSDSDGDATPSPAQSRRNRGRRGRNSSPRRSNRQCAVGLFGGGGATSNEPPSTPRSRFGGRREGSNLGMSTPIRTVRSSPDLTYAAAAAAAASARDGDADNQDAIQDDPSPPRGSRGRRGAVKVVASSVGQRASMAQPLLLAGVEGVGRGPSYPPRAVEILEDGSNSPDAIEQDATTSSAAQGSRGRSTSTTSCGSASPQPFRFRLLSNSSHLLMLSLELDMIKKQKISAPLKPRWGKHRANDFNPLPSTISYSSTSALFAPSSYLRSPFSGDASAGECDDGDCQPCTEPKGVSRGRANKPGASVSTIGGGLRDPSSRLRFSWKLTDIASALDGAPTPTRG
ncbi:hypothetical protein PSEUBRA_004663 [Kalmanozyma brasiliensis GHG001]|uniref:uncharacterized protein n=1 Tax=Kalmanozyma brasiliensis (strain GHG001) TaxID=1365824 RepID=UPI002867E87C|nr:uncharacterized protein PSEUBRA_004663 [Kalmanozyma brasiliensis GHG001]KAF6767403.1 hypothetical protein PSEUBRA_004663 [Kalmanozyma brasiliensis GHG001]